MRDRFVVFGQWLTLYEKYLTAGAFLLGFVIDNLTLTRIDLWFDNLVLLSYLLLAASGIALLNIVSIKGSQNAIILRIYPWLSLIVQFAFGGLFSGYFVFYSRSASVISSWVFVLFLIGLLVVNERFKHQYSRFRFQVAILFIAIFSFAIFSLPTLLGHIGPWVFVLSGLVSVMLFAGFLYGLSWVIPEKIQSTKIPIARITAVIFVLFNVLYFIDAIPPLPLSLKDAGVYHAIERDGEGYAAFEEEVPWYKFYESYNHTIHRVGNESIYVYSAVFAPTKLETNILHEWEYFDEKKLRWIPAGTFSFGIAGGRDEGYRGYTNKNNLFEGEWRVNVTTSFGQTIGRVRFEIVDVSQKTTLKEVQL